MLSRSEISRSLLVAWYIKANGRSSNAIPSPLSSTMIRNLPPSVRDTRIRVAPASRAFSVSSLTAEAGRSTTSPAAIRDHTFSGSDFIAGIN